MEALKDFQLRGNTVHNAWFQTITKANGKADLVTINILAEIVYWYKPVEVREELTGAHIGWKNKYKEDLLQKSYTSLADQFGLTERQVKESIKHLEKLGVVKRVFRTITRNGMTLHNVLYLKLDKDKLEEISVIDVEKSSENKEKRKRKRKRKVNNTDKKYVVCRKSKRGRLKSWRKSSASQCNAIPPTLECDTPHIIMSHPPHSNVTPPALECGTPHIAMSPLTHSNVTPPTLECETNTYITTEITSKNTTESTQTNVRVCVTETVPYQEIVEAFNSICKSLVKAQRILNGRKQAIENIWRIVDGDIQVIYKLFNKAEESDFLSGKVKEWSATFDWIMTEENAVKILEGQYDNRQPANNNKGSSFTRIESHDWDLDELERRASEWALRDDEEEK